MFQHLGRLVSRYWFVIIAAWLLVLGGTYLAAPPWDTVALDREFAFLPADAPSRRSEEMFRQAFPDEPLGSNIVLVVHRSENEPAQVAPDKKFIEDVLEPGLRQIAKEEGGLASEQAASDEPLFSDEPKPAKPTGPKPIMARLRTPNAPGTGALLVSPDGKVLLVLVELTSEFLSKDNWAVIDKVENLARQLREQGRLPAGLDIVVTGSAVVGRDHTQAQLRAARDTGVLTVVLVVVLLLLIYRAPLLALIPLATVYVSVQLALNVLALLAEAGAITLFQGIQIYITILAYGAGVDYCLFLTARYRETLDGGGVDLGAAVAGAVQGVGAALTASAATVICGIAMMAFASFGKFREAGYAIPLALFIVLAATLTLSPALFRLVGRWAFWPQLGKAAATAEPSRLRLLQRGWRRVEEALLLRPGLIWLATVAVMAPFAVAALVLHNHLSYDLVGNLPADAGSVVGTRILSQHMPTGTLGPTTVLLVDPKVDFRSKAGRELVQQVTRTLDEQKDALGVADVRSLTQPLGSRAGSGRPSVGIDVPASVRKEAIQRIANDYYTTDLGGRAKVGTRVDVILQNGPFAQESIADLGRIEQAVQQALPPAVRADMQVYAVGTTASVRDLQTVMQGDRGRIQGLVLASVLLVLLVLLRRLVVPVYLLLSVLFSYYTTLGVAFALFWALDPQGFTGIDWKVAIFLFTILIAVGEDYNILLMTRVREETERFGPERGVTEALIRTGPIISSCGIIMAGTFASLLVGQLTEMKQLGFALAFGVLLDTFVVRPILVPAFLIVWRRWRTPALDSVRGDPLQQVRGALASRSRADGGATRS